MPKPSHLRSVDPTPTPAAQGAAPRPSGVAVETLPKPGKRRKFSAAEKLRIVRAAAACTERGDIEALLRREGIYSSLLAAWRKQLALHGSEALAGASPAASRSTTRRTGASPSLRSARRGSRRSSRSLRSSSTSKKKSLPFWVSISRPTKSADGRHRGAR
ncbi:transposase [Sorangium sp. So ce1036]|uniref:transposase n=1 Tax=Sorangium sp. So ce1036 TaxID=3133328 RepID=UPI003F51E38F